MSRWISCDDVFERLTRGPFPSGGGAPDVATALRDEHGDVCVGKRDVEAGVEPDVESVEAHLAVCHACRELAEALRPAARELRLASAVRPIPEPSLPVYRGRLPERSTAEARPALPSAVRPAANPWQLATAGWPVALALALGVVVGAMAAGGWFDRPASSARQVAWSVGPVDLARDAREVDTVLGRLQLQPVCWKPASDDGPSDDWASAGSVVDSRDGRRCCTACHHSGSTQARSIDVARLHQACIACHR